MLGEVVSGVYVDSKHCYMGVMTWNAPSREDVFILLVLEGPILEVSVAVSQTVRRRRRKGLGSGGMKSIQIVFVRIAVCSQDLEPG